MASAGQLARPRLEAAAMCSIGFDMESWEDFAELGEGGARDGRCAWPDCRRPFNAAKTWQRYCGPACRRADQDEARKIGHMIARPVLAMREGKHAKPRTRAAVMAATARRYVDQVASRWREARARRAAEAEARLEAGA